MAKSSTWEEAYRSVESLWGLKPDRTLIEYAKIVPKGNVLDLGVGEGRNALFFAEMGYNVEGVDISQTAIERCIERAKMRNLKVKAGVGDLKEVEIPQGRYSLIIAAWVLTFFRKSEVQKIVGKMKGGLMKDGFVYVAVFSPSDPGYERAKQSLQEVEDNTFYSSRRSSHIHYFTRDEIHSVFAGFKTIYYVEGKGLDLDHDEPHYHGFIEYLAQKVGEEKTLGALT